MENNNGKFEADITGLQVEAVEGWQELIKEVSSEMFEATVRLKPEVARKLTGTQIDRLESKLHLVQYGARVMAAGMLKGTLKYPSDDYELAQWMAHIIGEGADQMNYQLLTLDAFLKQQ